MNSSKSRDNLQELWGRTIIGEEALPGGRAKGKKPSDFDQDELDAGIKVEHEHLVGGGYSKQETEDIAREIAMDHLTEIPDYYTRLDKMESEAGVKVASVPKKYEHIDFKPPQGVADAAAKGLELRQKANPSNRGGLTTEEASKEGIGSGVQRAVNLKNRNNVTPKVIKQMKGFLSRSEKSSEISAENKGTPWNDKGYVAWLLWGGDPAKAWVSKVIKQMEAADEKEKQSKQAALMERWGSMLVTADENEPTNTRIALISIYNAWPNPPDHEDWRLTGVHGLLSSLTAYEWALVNDMIRSQERILVTDRGFDFNGYSVDADAIGELQAAGYLAEAEDGFIGLSDELVGKMQLYKTATNTPTFDKKKARLQRIQMKREAAAKLRSSRRGESD